MEPSRKKPMATQSSVDRETFLKRLRDSGLLPGDEFQPVYELATQHDRGRTLARALVEHKLITRFQAEMLLAGRTDGFILGQYRILDQIGRGGMGRVFKAEHSTMNRIVALKVLSNTLTRTERARQLFQREVRAAARLVHPNIVTAYDANESGDRLYLVMEFVDGPNLQELVLERGPLPVGQACEFIRQAALGLHYAHEMGMVHRDIKPANLLVHRTGGSSGCVVKILDFGLARLQEPKSGATQGTDSLPAVEQAVMGTPDFLSPEQAKNLHNVDIRSDLYSLGCTLFYLLTAQVPFPGGTALEKLVRHGSEDPVPLSQLRADVPREVSDIVTKLMAKTPEDRFQTPHELAAALAPFSALGSGNYKPLRLPATANELPGSGESPWADLDADDPTALAGTMPAHFGLTGIGTTATDLPKKGDRKKPARPWLLPTLILAAALALAGIAIAIALVALR